MFFFFSFQISGISPLHIAAEKSHQDVIELLLKNGAEVGCRKGYDFALLCVRDRGDTFRFGGWGWGGGGGRYDLSSGRPSLRPLNHRSPKEYRRLIPPHPAPSSAVFVLLFQTLCSLCSDFISRLTFLTTLVRHHCTAVHTQDFCRVVRCY